VTTSTVQKWESPASGKHPGGTAAKLLQIIDIRLTGEQMVTVLREADRTSVSAAATKHKASELAFFSAM
jgi:hypothetical protein